MQGYSWTFIVREKWRTRPFNLKADEARGIFSFKKKEVQGIYCQLKCGIGSFKNM
jgi:hypothetical protein